ncbi:GFA family protein [Pseudoroseicyclus sp. CXY001]|uniref:GFA family protein n=1 Tax=Pseudoroseicyclus sp. CXY001 TaxID=3242492 RepID=UPI003570CCC0
MTELSCRCGEVVMEVTGQPIVSVECCCTSCRTAAGRLESLPGAPRLFAESGAVPYVLFRKDRVRMIRGEEHLRDFRLGPEAATRRVVAGCCGSPVYLEFKGGHWLSVFGTLWPEGARPALEMRTMAKDLPPGATLPEDVPNARTQPLGFMGRLLAAWVAMGFRAPKIQEHEALHV